MTTFLQLALSIFVFVYSYGLILVILSRLAYVDTNLRLVSNAISLTKFPANIVGLLIPAVRRLDLPRIIVYVGVSVGILYTFFVLVQVEISLSSLVLLSLSQLFVQTIQLLIFAIVINSILSWFKAGYQSQVWLLSMQLLDWIYTPVRKYINPRIGALDLTPMLVLMFLYFVLYFFQAYVSAPLIQQITDVLEMMVEGGLLPFQ